jgi:magnesium transporter
LIQTIRPHLNPEVFTFLDETVRDEVARLLNPQELAAAVADLESDDAFSLIEDLDAQQQEEVLRSITPEERLSLEESLSYPEYSAGRLMQKEVVALKETCTIAQALQTIAKGQHLPDVFYDLFVVDQDHRPLGVVPLSRLLSASPQTPLSGLMTPNLQPIPATLDQEQVALQFKRYSLLSAPVVNEKGALIGMVTLDDVFNVLDAEAEEDILHLGGVATSDFYFAIFPTIFARLQWLIVTLLNTLLASAVISHFHLALEKKVALAVLMPIVASMGGSAGMQVITVTVRALSNQALDQVNMLRTLGKEVTVCLFNGLICAVLLGVVATFWYGDVFLSIVLGSAMVFNMLWAGFAGTVIPLLVARLGMDPALSAGPLLNTTTDVFGFAVFLGLSMCFLV